MFVLVKYFNMNYFTNAYSFPKYLYSARCMLCFLYWSLLQSMWSWIPLRENFSNYLCARKIWENSLKEEIPIQCLFLYGRGTSSL